MTTDLLAKMKKTKKASEALLFLSDVERNEVLKLLAQEIRCNTETIITENKKDLAKMDPSDPMVDRLLLTKERIGDIAASVECVATLDSPLGRTLSTYHHPQGMIIEKQSVPLGVVAVVYESRPNVTIDVFSLCFKTGNACILKGGKEAFYTNQSLVGIIQEALRQSGVTPDTVFSMLPDRQAMITLLEARGLVDVCIPRGSEGLIKFVRDYAKIPVIETGAGIVHVYFDQHGDLAKGGTIIDNAKTRRVAVCNALDCLLIHKDRLNDLPQLLGRLSEKIVELYADEVSYPFLKSFYPTVLLHEAHPEDFGREFLSLKMAVKVVDSLEDAIDHIKTYTSGHSEAIITENEGAASHFIKSIDASVVYVNASTAFTDGGEFGMGAEIGISTQKLHARGPMALEALTSYKWIVTGSGQIR